MARVIVATVQPWNIRRYRQWAERTPHECALIQQRAELLPEKLAAFHPDYVFFPHWSWKIPTEIHAQYECIVFHMTDVPFGRGGSPLQNLLIRGLYSTQMSALRVVDETDAGPVYLKRPLCLHGSASEIYLRAADLAFQMIDDILERRPTPVPQAGEVVQFKRRAPEQSEIKIIDGDLVKLHDFVRMLDAEGYPRAFLVHEGLRYEFSRAVLRDGFIEASVKIRQNQDTV